MNILKMSLHWRFSWKWWLLLLSVATLIFIVVAVISPMRLAICRSETGAKLQNIQIALECYYKDHGCYPPQYLIDQQGKPAHSWRVLLLPYLNEEELYLRYRFDEPWNGPHNAILTYEMPDVYRSPFVDSRSTITQYVGIAGKDTLWQGANVLQLEDDLIRSRAGFDSEGNEVRPLVWFVEAANSDINWMEPRDISLQQALVGINIAGGIKSNYSEGLPAQMVLRSWGWVPTDISTDAFRAMLSIGNKTNRPVQ